jgi:hypothetical protein
MYSTSTPDTRVLWAAHSYNVAFSDEIGHFEYCATSTSNFRCATGADGTGATPDFDDRSCFPAPIVGPTGNTLSPSFDGCLFTDVDFDGPEYQQGTWPGSQGAVASNVSTPVVFSSPLFAKSGPGSGGPSASGAFNTNYDRVAFETDLPRIEGADSSTNNACQRHYANPADPSPGTGCINPPNGATFYPIFSTVDSGGACLWEEGGDNIAGATNNFGGNPAEYGNILVSNYPAGPSSPLGAFSVTQRGNNFHRNLDNNPCPATK